MTSSNKNEKLKKYQEAIIIAKAYPWWTQEQR